MIVAMFRLIVAGALIGAIGGHWALLQSIAWTGMVITYAHDSGWKGAIEKTFDGKHPCKLCKVVAEGKRSERSHESLKTETKLDFFCCREVLALRTPARFQLPQFNPQFSPDRAEIPPVPPPRFA